LVRGDDLDKIYVVIDEKLSEIRPNFGYVEKYVVCEQILNFNDYLLPESDAYILAILDLIFQDES
jgi:hypothetical protein